jgi:RNA polymerase sigma factor (sigma-70 family)
MKRIIQHLFRLVSSEQVEGEPDRELLERFAAQHDEAAFAALLRRHGPMVLAVCRRVLGNANDAEDAFQATFLILIRKANAIGRPERLGNWLYGVAYRTALDARGNRARRQTRERQVVEMPAAEVPGDPVWQDLRSILDEELNRLPEKYRAPLVFCYLEGKTKDETARQLGWPEGTVSGRLARAKEMVRSRLERRGLALTSAVLGAALTGNAAPAAVPASLLDATIRVGLLFAAGQGATAGALAAPVSLLTERVLRTMSLGKLKTAAAVLLTVTVLATSAGVLAFQSFTANRSRPAVTASHDDTWVESRVQAWQPTPAERRFDEIGWVRTVREAERLAAAHGRPVFLFVYDGSVANARCGGAASTLRAGPLSNDRVISLLNRYFVPICIASQDYQGEDFPQPAYPTVGAAPPEEQRAWKRIYDEAQKAKLNLRATQVYVLSPDGRPIDALRLVPSEKVENLLPFLERTVAKLQPAAGQPVISPVPQFAPPKAAADALVLHVTARYLNRKGGEEVPFAPEERGLGVTGDSWRALPAEDWVVFDRADWTKLLPGGAPRPGLTWEIDREWTARLLTHFYPQTANTDVSRNVFLRQGLTARITSVQGNLARAYIEGSLVMQHDFAREADDNLVRATLVGFMDFEPGLERIRAFRLVTDQATYGGGRKDKGQVGYDPPVPIGVAVRSLP